MRGVPAALARLTVSVFSIPFLRKTFACAFQTSPLLSLKARTSLPSAGLTFSSAFPRPLSMTGGGSEPKPTSAAMWDERYGHDEYIYGDMLCDLTAWRAGTAPNDFLAGKAKDLKPGSKILCIAEGEGRNGVYLAKQGHTVVGVDNSKAGLAKFSKLAQKEGVTVEAVLADLAEYDLGQEQWDAIVSIFCHLPAPLRKRVHTACVSALKPGGCVILEAYNPKQLEYKTGGPPVVEMLFTKEMLMEDFQGLEVSTNEELVREVVEGTHHTGTGAVVQFVAYKR